VPSHKTMASPRDEPADNNSALDVLRKHNTVQNKKEAGPAGIEPTTPGLKVRCSSLAELRALVGNYTAHRRNKKEVF
jgi:hypothetical protein